MLEISKDILDEMINKEGLSYQEIGRKYGYSGAYIKKYAKKIGVSIPCRRKTDVIPWNKGRYKTIVCLNCNKEVINKRGSYNIFCCYNCAAEYKTKKKYQNYLNNQSEYVGKEITYQWLKPIILKEQGNKCSICGMSTIWNQKELHFVLDHIDGDATNNIRNNLRLICPNCDSQLDTYKSRNMGRSTRKYKPYSIRNL